MAMSCCTKRRLKPAASHQTGDYCHNRAARGMLVGSALALLSISTASAAPVDDASAVAMVKPQEQIVAGGISTARLSEILKPIDAFYGFWTNGSAALLAASVSPRFIDHTLPPGRPQGPTGPAAASKAFLNAVPDLKVTVVQRLIVSDRVVSHLRFTGRFTGTFQGLEGVGQAIEFIATDIVRVRNGRITDNWHIEDNLTFLKQIGAIPKS